MTLQNLDIKDGLLSYEWVKTFDSVFVPLRVTTGVNGWMPFGTPYLYGIVRLVISMYNYIEKFSGVEMDNKPKSVAILIINKKGEVLQMLRDDKPTIQYPNTWVSIGGQVEAGESFEEAIVREVYEELEIQLDSFDLFKIYEWPEKTEAIFIAHSDLDPSSINLHEGQKIEFFSEEELRKLKFGFHDEEILNDYFSQQDK